MERQVQSMATSKTNNQSFIKDALALCLITLVAGALLGFVYELTKGPIEEAKLKEKLSAYESVFPEAADFAEDEAVKAAVTSEAYTNALAAAGVDRAAVQEAYQALDASGNVIGYAMVTDSTNGYSGQISISVGIKLDGTISGMEFLVMNETQGIGAKATEPDFMNQFVGKTTDQFALGENVDAMSGATVTSKAVTNAMNAALVFVQQMSAAQ